MLYKTGIWIRTFYPVDPDPFGMDPPENILNFKKSRTREREMINKIEIDTHLLVKSNQQR